MSIVLLKFIKGPFKGRAFEVEGERISFGRDANCDVVIDEDTNLSRQHAFIVIKEHEAVLVDNDSRNGVFINSVAIQEQELKNNDVIQMGDSVIRVSLPNALIGDLLEETAKAPSLKARVKQFLEGKMPALAGIIFRDGSASASFENSSGGDSAANKKRIVLYGILGIAVILHFSSKKDSKDTKKIVESSNVKKEAFNFDNDTNAKRADKWNAYDDVLKEDLDEKNLRKKISKLYAKALLFHDIGKYNESIAVLDDILELNSEYLPASLKKNQWLQERNTLGENLLSKGTRNFENRYFHKSKDYFKQVLLLIPEKNHSLHQQAAEGLRAVNRRLEE